jgi:hypothetical protein
LCNTYAFTLISAGNGYTFHLYRNIEGEQVANIRKIDASVITTAATENNGVLQLPDTISYQGVDYPVCNLELDGGVGPVLNGIVKLIMPKGLETVTSGWSPFDNSLAFDDDDDDDRYGTYNSDDSEVYCPDLVTIECGESLVDMALCFWGCPVLENIIWPGMKEFRESSFWYAGFKSLSFPDSLTQLGVYSFYELPNLVDLDLNNVQIILRMSFSKCHNLKTVEIPSSVKFIGYGAFSNLPSLEQIVFKASTSEAYSEPLALTSNAFAGCPKLKTIRLECAIPPIAYQAYDGGWSDSGLESIIGKPEIVFGQVRVGAEPCEPLDLTKIKLLVPIGTAEAYRNSVTWGAFTDIEEYDVSGIAETELQPDWKLSDNLNIKAGAIELTNLNGNAVSVYGIDGRLINSSVATGTWTVAVPHGVYLVNVDSTTAKVMVK